MRYIFLLACLITNLNMAHAEDITFPPEVFEFFAKTASAVTIQPGGALKVDATECVLTKVPNVLVTLYSTWYNLPGIPGKQKSIIDIKRLDNKPILKEAWISFGQVPVDTINIFPDGNALYSFRLDIWVSMDYCKSQCNVTWFVADGPPFMSDGRIVKKGWRIVKKGLIKQNADSILADKVWKDAAT